MKKNMNISESIIKGLEEAIAYEKGDKRIKANINKITICPLPHFRGEKIKKIREKLSLTQRSFAMLMGVSIKTIEAWESNRNEPNGSAQRMLSLLEKDKSLPEKYELIQFGHAR